MAFQHGLSGLNAASKNLDVIGNNIANTNTTGFKASRAEFADMMAFSMGAAGGSDAGIGVKVADVAQQFTQGSTTITDNNLDVAIDGKGFFIVQLPSGATAYTRAGNFQVDNTGKLITNQNAAVMDTTGTAPITITPVGLTNITIDSKGVVTGHYGGGPPVVAGTIGLVEFPNMQGLAPIGGNNWSETTASGAATKGAPSSGSLGVLRSGALEESNVDLTAELVNMMTAQRTYQANAQTIKTQDQVMSTLVNLR